ncbi:MAG: PLD nuclease N-terminal domain-containing protein [Armatimonadota bacterium]
MVVIYVSETAAVGIGLTYLIFMMFLLGIGLLFSVFWIWMLIDCATQEPSEGNTKIVWILVILLGHFIGALVYFCVRRPQRKTEMQRVR